MVKIFKHTVYYSASLSVRIKQWWHVLYNFILYDKSKFLKPGTVYFFLRLV